MHPPANPSARAKHIALLIESTKLSLQPYKLSNLDFVTESFTLIAGINNLLSFSNLFKALTPVVVSSETPLIFLRKIPDNDAKINLEKLIKFTSFKA